MKFSLCIDSIYPEDDLKEKLERIKQAGFDFIEFWDWRDKDLETIQTVSQLHLLQIKKIYNKK